MNHLDLKSKFISIDLALKEGRGVEEGWLRVSAVIDFCHRGVRMEVELGEI